MPSLPTSTTDSSVLLVQLSDSHLFAEAGGKLLGMDTCDSLRQVIEQMQQEQPDIDLILATGDLSQDGSQASYERFRSLTDSLRDLGAHNLNPGRPGGLTGRSRIRALIEAYERFRQPQGLPATYQVVYGVLQKPS